MVILCFSLTYFEYFHVYIDFNNGPLWTTTKDAKALSRHCKFVCNLYITTEIIEFLIHYSMHTIQYTMPVLFRYNILIHYFHFTLNCIVDLVPIIVLKTSLLTTKQLCFLQVSITTCALHLSSFCNTPYCMKIWYPSTLRALRYLFVFQMESAIAVSHIYKRIFFIPCYIFSADV